ncbi:MAG: hypothetical protein H7Y59_07955 [Anaerolineales bacterium]|nr:hypothetical protein [Anaerolineales bacterium]
MRFFLAQPPVGKFILLLSIIMVATSIILPRRYNLDFPRNPGPALDAKVRRNYIDVLVEQEPEIVLMGDSTLVLGLDADLLAQQTGKSVYSIGIPGSASALWYLILKNNIAESSYKPKYLLVVFRDTILTAPGYRVHGSYFELVDEYARRNEPLFIQNSFVNLMNPLEIAAEKYFPLYVSRTNIRNNIDAHIRYFSPALFGCDRNCTDYAMGDIFSGADLEPQALVNAVAAAESDLYRPDQMDFSTQVDQSYLPEMIRIAKQHNIQIVFVRIKVETVGPRITNSPAMLNYLDSLTDYLANENVPLLDFGSDPRLTHDLFYDSIHLNEQGQVVFTKMVADELKGILK